jgi:MFS family permease
LKAAEAVDASRLYTGRRRRLLLVALVMGVAATSFPTTLLSASLDVIADDLHSNLGIVSWVQVAPSLAFGLGMPLAGKLGDLYGHRRVYLAGFGLSTLMAGVTAAAWNPIALIVMRTIGQLGGAAAGPAAFAMIATALPDSERAKAIALLNTVGGLSPVVAVVVGGPLIDALGWRSLFLLQAAPSAAALLLAFPVVPETIKRLDVRFDVVGAVTLAGSAMALLLAINRVRPQGVTHPFVVTCFVLAPALLVAFVVVERRVASPLLPLQYLHSRPFSTSVLTMTLAQASFIGGFVVAPLLVQRLFDYSITQTSLLLTTRPLAFSVGSWIAGRSQNSLTLWQLQLWGHGMLFAGSIAWVLGAVGRSMLWVVVALIVTGFGNGYSRTTLFTYVSSTVDHQDIGVATGVANMVSQIGGGTGTTVMSAIVADSRQPSAFGWSFGAGALVAFLTLPACLRLRTSARRGGRASR